jgi:hypothetical protein
MKSFVNCQNNLFINETCLSIVLIQTSGFRGDFIESLDRQVPYPIIKTIGPVVCEKKN